MVSYEKARVKLTNTQLNKLKTAAKIRLEYIKNNKEKLDEELRHELFLT